MTEKKMRVFADYLISRLSVILLIFLLWTTASAQVPLSVLGYWTCPPRVAVLEQGKKKKKKKAKKGRRIIWRFNGAASFEYILRTQRVMVARSFLMVVLWGSSGQLLPPLILGLPLLEWLLSGLLVAWPWLAKQPEMELGRLVVSQLRLSLCLLMGLGTIWNWLLPAAQYEAGQKSEVLSQLSNWWGSFETQTLRQAQQKCGAEFACWLSCESNRVLAVAFTTKESANEMAEENGDIENHYPQVSIKEIDGVYQIDLRGEFHFRVDKESTFWFRMVILLLRHLETSHTRQRGRATRDGRRPFLSQQYLAEAFGIKQPQISRWDCASRTLGVEVLVRSQLGQPVKFEKRACLNSRTA